MTFAERIEAECLSWVGTRYVPGACVKGGGVDCVRFMAGVLDSLFGTKAARTLPVLPMDSSWNSKRSVVSIIVACEKIWPVRCTMKAERVPAEAIPPGSICLVQYVENAPGHVILMGTERFVGWHSTNEVGVCRTPINQHRVRRVWEIE